MAQNEETQTAWRCPVCGFEAKNEQEKSEHMRKTAQDPRHKSGSEKDSDEEEDEE